MMTVYTGGYIANAWGLYSGNTNGVSILNEFLQTDMWSQYEVIDVLCVDHAFQDSICKISEKGYIPKISAVLNEGWKNSKE